MPRRVYALANQKGGVGKTTTAITLGSGLARAGHSVLLIDNDPQANATYALTGDAFPDANMYHVLVGGRPLAEIVIETTQDGLYLVPSDIDLAGAERELMPMAGPQGRLRKALQGANFDYIIIDAPPSLGYLTLNCLTAADGVIIPIDTGVFALRGISHLEKTIADVQEYLDRPDLSVFGVVCTMYDYTKLADQTIEEIRRRFGETVFNSVIPKNVKIGEAHKAKASVFEYAPDSTGAIAYSELVKEIIDRGN